VSDRAPPRRRRPARRRRRWSRGCGCRRRPDPSLPPAGGSRGRGHYPSCARRCSHVPGRPFRRRLSASTPSTSVTPRAGKPGCPLYDLAVLYGAPDESPGRGSRNTPASFLHFELLGGRVVPQAIGAYGRSGTRPLQRLIGTRKIAGHRGRLYFGLPYDRGGGEYGAHYTFVWRQGAWGYAASLHSWTPHRDTPAVLAAIIAHLAARSAAPDAALEIPVPQGAHGRVAYGGSGADPGWVARLQRATRRQRLPAT
jgi:hypothetical protein